MSDVRPDAVADAAADASSNDIADATPQPVAHLAAITRAIAIADATPQPAAHHAAITRAIAIADAAALGRDTHEARIGNRTRGHLMQRLRHDGGRGRQQGAYARHRRGEH